MLLVVMLFGIATVFAQAYTINVSWDYSNCDCYGTTSENYFKVTISVYDDANSEYVIQNYTTTTPDATYQDIDISVSSIQTYCGQIHQYTPSFTIYATVWLMENYSNPPTECCTDNDSDSPYSCQDFSSGLVTFPELTLN
jgi:hypothetical protein